MVFEPEQSQEERLKRVLRPLVRYCYRHSTRIQSFIKILKTVYIEVAIQEMERAGEKVNMSRINVATGIQRSDIAKIYKKNEAISASVGNTVERVIGQWTSDSRFLTKDEKPRVLSDKGPDSEFGELVSLVTTSVGPKAVLFELERANAVERTKTGIKLTTERLTYGKNRERAVKMLGESLEALLGASYENGLSEKQEVPHLHIRTFYDNVFQEDIPKIRAWLKREGRKFHKRAREYISQYDRDITADRDDPAGGTVVVGAFGIATEETRPELVGE